MRRRRHVSSGARIATKRVFRLADGSAVDPHAVAGAMGVPVITERDQFAMLPPTLRDAMFGTREWSAGTLEGRGGPLIILNPIHAPTRLKVTLAEEIAHLVMGHPTSEIDPVIGIRAYNATVEQKAFSVGGALVMPYGQLFRLAKAGSRFRRSPTRSASPRRGALPDQPHRVKPDAPKASRELTQLL